MARTVVPLAFSRQNQCIEQVSTRRRARIGWHLELCAEERAQTVDVGSNVPPNPPHRRLCPWRPKPARPVFGSGKPSRMTTNTATPSVIVGMSPTTCSRQHRPPGRCPSRASS